MLKSKLLPMIVVIPGILAVLLVGCAQPPGQFPDRTLTPIPSTAATLPPKPTPIQTPVPTATLAPTTLPASSTVAAPLSLVVLEPADESVVDVSGITIRGKTLPDAVLSVNGDSVDVDQNGNFFLPVVLDEGPNVFDITAADEQGNEVTIELVVSYVL